MTEYVHAVPGRLRIKTSRMRRSSAASLAEGVAQIEGVLSATVNPATGSLIVIYDRDALSLDPLWAALHRLGCVSEPSPPTDGRPDATSAAPAPAVAQMLAQAAFGALVDALAQRTATTLVRALI